MGSTWKYFFDIGFVITILIDIYQNLKHYLFVAFKIFHSNEYNYINRIVTQLLILLRYIPYIASFHYLQIHSALFILMKIL